MQAGKRSTFAAVVLAVLVVSAPGLASPQAPPRDAADMGQLFFGSTLARAEVVSVAGSRLHDYRIDVGRIVGVRPGALDVMERDGTLQTIPIDPTTDVAGPRGGFDANSLSRGQTVLTLRDGDGAAQLVRIVSLRSLGPARLASTQVLPSRNAADMGRFFFGNTLARAEVVSVVGGRVHDYRIDEGRIVSIRQGALDVKERDGTRQTIPVDPTATEVVGLGGVLGINSLSRGQAVLTLRDGDGAAQQVRILGLRSALTP